MILAGDIGGTNTRLAIFDVKRKKVRETKFKSADYPSLAKVVLEFLAEDAVKPEKAVFGIAGPIKNGRCQATNLPWIIDAKELSSLTKIPAVYLINDLEANAYGIRALKENEFYVLNKGDPKNTGNAALISAGTGLGEAGFYWDGKTHHPFACEGGHSDFGPRNDIEDELLKYLRQKFGHVSYERVVSGPGIANLYHFLVDTKKEKPLEGHFDDLPKAISEKAVAKNSPLCSRIMELFISAYGAEAGNLALKCLALSGVYIGGGIAPKILSLLKEGSFMQGFLDKGRFKGLLATIPIKIVLNDDTALLGAVEYAFIK